MNPKVRWLGPPLIQKDQHSFPIHIQFGKSRSLTFANYNFTLRPNALNGQEKDREVTVRFNAVSYTTCRRVRCFACTLEISLHTQEARTRSAILICWPHKTVCRCCRSFSKLLILPSVLLRQPFNIFGINCHKQKQKDDTVFFHRWRRDWKGCIHREQKIKA